MELRKNLIICERGMVFVRKAIFERDGINVDGEFERGTTSRLLQGVNHPWIFSWGECWSNVVLQHVSSTTAHSSPKSSRRARPHGNKKIIGKVGRVKLKLQFPRKHVSIAFRYKSTLPAYGRHHRARVTFAMKSASAKLLLRLREKERERGGGSVIAPKNFLRIEKTKNCFNLNVENELRWLATLTVMNNNTTAAGTQNGRTWTEKIFRVGKSKIFFLRVLSHKTTDLDCLEKCLASVVRFKKRVGERRGNC